MGKSKNNGTNFLVQGSILAVASIISRIIGLVYRIPLNNILGDVGISYYACAFDVYNVILIISSYSLPQAVSKTVSAKAAKGQYRSVYQITSASRLLSQTAGPRPCRKAPAAGRRPASQASSWSRSDRFSVPRRRGSAAFRPKASAARAYRPSAAARWPLP